MQDHTIFIISVSQISCSWNIKSDSKTSYSVVVLDQLLCINVQYLEMY